MNLTNAPMRILVIACAFGLVQGHASAGDAPATQAQIEDGRILAEKECSVCHAVGIAGRSPRYGAPEFRHILSRYSSDNLRVNLVEGIKLGHPTMPRFWFPPAGVDSLIAYLRSIQTPEHAAPEPD